MSTSLIHPDRVRLLTGEGVEPRDGSYVLYWMQRAQRAQHNDALEHAARLANEHSVPLLVAFGLADAYPRATARHYRFMLEGLGETVAALERRGIGVTVRRGAPPEVAAELARDALVVVVDRAYERHLVAWRRTLIEAVACPVVEVECDVVVPVEIASDHREYAARTIRPRLHARLDEYVEVLRTTSLDRAMADAPSSEVDVTDADAVLAQLGLPTTAEPQVELRGGTSQARSHLRTFLEHGLAGYSERRPDPLDPRVSHLSPYLHFGQVSPVAVLLAVRAANAPASDVAAFTEELVVRRELAVNYVRYEADYDRYAALPDWARASLEAHRADAREPRYTATELEAGRTHDAAWNAAMALMRETGYLHNHLRMYWGKQVLRWTSSPEHAFRTLLELNDRYFLDGRDCSSYANVAWLFGLHDQAFAERPVTGKTRPMTRGGLERKFDVSAWLATVRSRFGHEAVDGPDGAAR
ncbi:MAG: deoxyribodipyrimidine photo-lyase [Chloroflexota bacterium]|jgi:deoxyribodipyrimidine photo-lyase